MWNGKEHCSEGKINQELDIWNQVNILNKKESLQFYDHNAGLCVLYRLKQISII